MYRPARGYCDTDYKGRRRFLFYDASVLKTVSSIRELFLDFATRERKLFADIKSLSLSALFFRDCLVGLTNSRLCHILGDEFAFELQALAAL